MGVHFPAPRTRGTFLPVRPVSEGYGHESDRYRYGRAALQIRNAATDLLGAERDPIGTRARPARRSVTRRRTPPTPHIPRRALPHMTAVRVPTQREPNRLADLRLRIVRHALEDPFRE